MIQLEITEKQWIKLCKGHYKEKYPFTGRWVDYLKPMFTKVYGWNPDEDNNYYDYLNCIFNKLLNIHLKIQHDQSGSNRQLREIFSAAFYKSIVRTDELPIERAIACLYGLIQMNTVYVDGVPRYEL